MMMSLAPVRKGGLAAGAAPDKWSDLMYGLPPERRTRIHAVAEFRECRLLAQSRSSGVLHSRSGHRRITDVPARMSVHRRIPDAAPSGAEGRSLTQTGSSSLPSRHDLCAEATTHLPLWIISSYSWRAIVFTQFSRSLSWPNTVLPSIPMV